MEASERVFRHSPVKVALIFFGVLFFGFFAFSIGQPDYFLLGITGIVLVVALLYATSSVKISSEEITTKGLLGSKSLRWSEIGRISTWSEILRLHSRDEDLTLSIDSLLAGYPDLLDIIFSKRPDLLDKNDDHVMTINWPGSIASWGTSLFIIWIAVFQFWGTETEDVDKIFSLIFFAIAASIIVKWFLAPKSLMLEDKNLIIGYWFKEASHSASDIDYVSLQKQRTRNGYIYFAQITLVSGKKIRLPAFKQGTQLTYQILKRWHKKAVAN